LTTTTFFRRRKSVETAPRLSLRAISSTHSKCSELFSTKRILSSVSRNDYFLIQVRTFDDLVNCEKQYFVHKMTFFFWDFQKNKVFWFTEFKQSFKWSRRGKKSSLVFLMFFEDKKFPHTSFDFNWDSLRDYLTKLGRQIRFGSL